MYSLSFPPSLSFSLQHVPPVVQLMDVVDRCTVIFALCSCQVSHFGGVINFHIYIFISLTAALYHLSCAATALTH